MSQLGLKIVSQLGLMHAPVKITVSDQSLFNLAGHFDRPHMIKIPQKHYSNDDNIAYSPLYNVIFNVLSV